MSIDEIALRFLAAEEFCTTFELDELVRLNGGSDLEAEQLRTNWAARGWIESISQGSGAPPVLHLTDRALADLPWLGRAT